MDYPDALKHIKKIAYDKHERRIVKIVDYLYKSFDKYGWIGIYFVDGSELVLGPWEGPTETEHTRIAIGEGICGAAAASGNIEVIDDVQKDPRYLACFVSTRSEIVVPIYKKGVVIGEIDIDLDRLGEFSNEDVRFLEAVAEVLGTIVT